MAESKINNTPKVAVISKDVITNNTASVYIGGYYAHVDLEDELNLLLGNYTRAKAVVPIGATLTTDNGVNGILSYYSVDGNRLTQFALNASLNATYRCYFAVLY